jgi:bacillithiol synthase
MSSSQTLPLQAVGAFPTLFLDYISKNDSLKPFYGQYPDIQGFAKAIEAKNFDTDKRKTLVNVLEKQYLNIEKKPVDFSVLLNENTFTVTTGHQLNIFTGPLYVIYKIITAINLAKSLKNAYPAYNFVPVYWLASEDHDFEEIASFNLFGKKHTWKTEQKGAVGRMNPKELKQVFDEMPEKVALFENAYLKNDTLSNAVRQYMNELFGEHGLVCLDADDNDLKSEFREVMRDDLLNNTANKIVEETSQKLENLGYKNQISPREINFFYLAEGLRERIVKEGNIYKVLNTELTFSEQEIIQLIDNEPISFSPNVVLRPVYQETILPNLAYIGGPSEVPYWLQLGDLLKHYNQPIPMLMPRNFAVLLTPVNAKRMKKLGISPEELFYDELKLRRNFVEQNCEHSLTLIFEIDEISQIFERIEQKAGKIDPTMKAAVDAEKTRLVKHLEKLEKRLRKSEERNQEINVSQLKQLKADLFPESGLQERKDNFLNFYFNDKSLIIKLLANFDALNYVFYLMEI